MVAAFIAGHDTDHWFDDEPGRTLQEPAEFTGRFWSRTRYDNARSAVKWFAEVI